MRDNRSLLAGQAKMAIHNIEREEIKNIMRGYCQHEGFKDQISEDELFQRIANKLAFYEGIIERHFDPYLPGGSKYQINE